MLSHQVPRNPAQKRCQTAARRIELARFTNEREKHFLRNFFRHRRASTQEPRQPMDARVMPVVQLREGRFVACGAASEEFTIRVPHHSSISIDRARRKQSKMFLEQVKSLLTLGDMMNFRVFAIGFAVALPMLAADAAQWPQFRGPGGSGIAGDTEAPVSLPATSRAAWKADVPAGQSSPSV